MAAVAPQADQAADMFQKMSLDTHSKANDIPEATKKPSVDSGNNTKGAQPDRSFTPLLPDFSDPAAYYQNPYSTMYYGGYEASANEWEDYARFMNSDGVEMNPGNYGENGSLMYPHAYGYTPYGPYSPAVSPIPTTGHDGQMYGAQHYQYPYYPSMTPTSGPYTPSAATAKGDHATAAAGDQVPLSVDSTNSKANGIINGAGAKGAVPTRPAYQNSSYNSNGTYGRGNFPGANASGYQDARYGFDALQSPWLDSHYYQDGLTRPVTSSSVNSSAATGNGNHSSRTQNYQPHLMMAGMNAGQYGNSYRSGMGHSMYPNKMYTPYSNSYRSAMGYGSNGYDSRSSGRSWMSVDSKFKPRARGVFGYGNESIDGLNELNRGPRAKVTKPKFTPVALAVKGQNVPFVGAPDDEKQQKLSLTPDRDSYNRADFPETYTDAKFFIIKSYSEDDVHKSIKYNVWASTPNGNKKLDAAYQDAQQKTGGCPIFLFFSVNTSGQFVGVAEMVGPVDFEKNVEYWQQDKWIGCFPVKWHIVKDLPNTSLKHIILENNESKPVTNSRDTQEVKLDQGLEVLKIFKEHTSKQCILDDFDFYEDRQKRIQDKKAKQQLYQKQANRVWEGKASEDKNKEASNGDAKATDKSSEVASDLSTLAIQDSENKSEEVDKTVKPTENGIANGC